MMIRMVSVSLVLGCLLVMTSTVLAKGPQNVANSVHNLSVTGLDPSDPFLTPGESWYAARDEDQICVFCHTPHGGQLEGPLWNKPLPTSTWTHYNSTSLSTALQSQSTSRELNDESLICMSCHDGTVSVNAVHNLPNDRNGAAIVTDFNGQADVKIAQFFGTNQGARIGGAAGGDLSDDHPISFSYAAVYADPVYGSGGAKFNDLNDTDYAETQGVRFFGGTAKRVECSSCHDPHVDYLSGTGDARYRPFLIMPNTSSALCLACHNK